MTSPTSCYNAGLLRANLKRNRYLMLLQTIALFLASSLSIILFHAQQSAEKLQNNSAAFNALIRDFAGFNRFSLLFMIFFPVLISSFGQSYLFKRKATAFYHSLPYTRTQIYITNYLTGFISFIMPLIIIFGFNTIIFFSMGFSHYISYLILIKGLMFSVLFYSILFSVTMFAASLSGNVVAQLTMVLFVFGIVPAFKGIFQLCLTTWFDKIPLQNFESIPYAFPMLYLTKISFPHSSIMIGEILYCIGYALVFAILGGVCYHFRKSEDCDKFYVYTWVKRIFKYSLTFLVSLLLGIVLQQMVFDHHIFYMVIGFVIGGFMTFIITQSVFEKSFKAMFANMNAFIPFCIITCLLTLFVSADFFHVNDYMPKLKNIESIGIEFYDNRTEYGITNNIGVDPNKELILTDKKNVNLLYNAIQKGSEKEINETVVSPTISYQTNTIFGRVKRLVYLKRDLFNKTIAAIYDSKEYKDQYATMDFLKKDRQIISVILEKYASDSRTIYARDDNLMNRKSQILVLLKTLQSDMKTHTYQEISASQPYATIYVDRQNNGFDSNNEEYVIYNCYENTISYLKAHY